LLSILLLVSLLLSIAGCGPTSGDGAATAGPVVAIARAGDNSVAAAPTATAVPLPTPEPTATPTPGPTATPDPTPLLRTKNILLLGSDRRPDMPNWRTDVMMIVAIDEPNRRVGVVSLPRDIYVDYIAGHNANKINVVDYLGEQDEPNGGGPKLLASIIQDKLGIPIHNYVRFNFESVKNLVDALGGVEVEVDCPLYDPNRYDEGGSALALEPGVHRLDGGQALTYVRSRYIGGDLERERRQQRFAWAVRSQILRENLLPRVPALYQALNDSLQTDINLIDAVGLVRLALDLDSENIHGFVVNDPSMIKQGYAGQMWVWYPNWPNIAAAAQAVFDTPPLLDANIKDGEVKCP
jgi:LCP family protein required for cell wall assembly